MKLLLSALARVAGFAVSGATPLGLSVSTGGQLQMRGEPFRGVGVNYYDAIARTLGKDTRTNYDEGFLE